MEASGLKSGADNTNKGGLLGQGSGPGPFEDDKKDIYWADGVMSCFSSVLAIFKPDLKSDEDDKEWDVPFDSITELTYLGSGAQGVVFSGILRGEMIAVKKLRDKTETNIKHLRKLNHENIVRFRGVCSNPPFAVIMEFCQYGPLFEFLHSGANFTPQQILKWAKEVAYGMAYLHQHKIIHRDLKSPNILIADNLLVKVSDFGTSKEWNDVSAIMSFTGTVAWMAPEVIRHEPCSERIDIWSFGVVLWELLTQEIPYKNLETHSIMWGVGTDTISLPIPTTVPEGMQLLLGQCFNRTPRNRPPFKIIAAHLEIAGVELSSIKPSLFSSTQATWRREVQAGMEKMYLRSEMTQSKTADRREEMRQARDARAVYEKQMNRANELYMEVCTVRLQLEQREQELNEREKALKACKCGVKKSMMLQRNLHRSSSSDTPKPVALLTPTPESPDAEDERLYEIEEPAPVMDNFEEIKPEPQTITIIVDEFCDYDSDENNVFNNNWQTIHMKAPVLKETIVLKLKDTYVEKNGNVEIAHSHADMNDNGVLPDIAEV